MIQRQLNMNAVSQNNHVFCEPFPDSGVAPKKFGGHLALIQQKVELRALKVVFGTGPGSSILLSSGDRVWVPGESAASDWGRRVLRLGILSSDGETMEEVEVIRVPLNAIHLVSTD